MIYDFNKLFCYDKWESVKMSMLLNVFIESQTFHAKKMTKNLYWYMFCFH